MTDNNTSKSKKLVEVYYWPHCPFCQKALSLLITKDVDLKLYNTKDDADLKAKMVERTGGPSSVPQIFIENEFIPGGCDGLMKLETSGELDKKLNA